MMQELIDVDFNRNNCFVLVYKCNNSNATDVKMTGSALEEKSSFNILGLSSFSKWGWVVLYTSPPEVLL